MITRTFTFFSKRLRLTIPEDVLEDWSLIYDRSCFQTVTNWKDETVPHVFWEESDRENGRLHVEDRVYAIPRAQILLYVQDYVQNKLLPAMTSHLLWHAACWAVDDGVALIMGDSGAGKTTLSLAHLCSGGSVWSDEFAICKTGGSQCAPFQRALTAHRASLDLLNMPDLYPAVHLDEEKIVVPPTIVPRGTLAPIKSIIFLEWPRDHAVPQDRVIVEACIRNSQEQWMVALPDVLVSPHPDGDDWWRIESSRPVPSHIVEQAVHQHGGYIAGYHLGARRKPDFSGPPRLDPLDLDRAVQATMPHLMNARELARACTAPRALAWVRTALQHARCVRCEPGLLEPTLACIHAFAARRNP